MNKEKNIKYIWWIKAMLSQNATKLQALSFHLEKLLDSLNGCRLWASSPFGGVARSHARAARKRTRNCKRRGKRGGISSLHSIDHTRFIFHLVKVLIDTQVSFVQVSYFIDEGKFNILLYINLSYKISFPRRSFRHESGTHCCSLANYQDSGIYSWGMHLIR